MNFAKKSLTRCSPLSTDNRSYDLHWFESWMNIDRLLFLYSSIVKDFVLNFVKTKFCEDAFYCSF